MFTGSERFKGPWSLLLDSAKVFTSAGQLAVQSHDDRLVVLLAVHPADLPKLQGAKSAGEFRRSLVHANGHELALNGTQVPLDSLRFDVPESWPESFHADLLQPQTSGPGACQGQCVNCLNADCGPRNQSVLHRMPK